MYRGQWLYGGCAAAAEQFQLGAEAARGRPGRAAHPANTCPSTSQLTALISPAQTFSQSFRLTGAVSYVRITHDTTIATLQGSTQVSYIVTEVVEC